MKARAKGFRGNWFATVHAPSFPAVHEKTLPCIWGARCEGNSKFYDPGYIPGDRKWKQLAEALKSEGYAVLRSHKERPDGVWQMHRYIAIVPVSEIDTTDGLRLRYGDRVCNLEN